MTAPWLTVVVPTYARPRDLERCLAAIAVQVEPPAATVCVVRRGDAASAAVVQASGFAATVEVDQPGVLAAMLAGLRATTTAWVAFTDDDAEPSPTWTAQLRAAAVDGVVGVGGRDVLYDGEVARPTSLTTEVGRVHWSGRVTGNHHRGTGPARSVQVLKGVNAAYRADLLGLPTNLRGDGAQVHFEVAVGLAMATHGDLRYDPAITVLHRPSDRAGEDQRRAPSASAICDVAYNATFAMTAAGVIPAVRRAVRTLLVGDRSCPGLLRGTLAVLVRDHETAHRFGPSMAGTASALADTCRGRRVAFAYRDSSVR